MTSTPVKDVNSLMNFVRGTNPAKTGGMNQAGGFGDVMSKAQSGASGSSNKMSQIAKTGKIPSADIMKSRTDAVKPQNPAKDGAKSEGVSEDQVQAAQQAGQQIEKEVARELDVTEEDVERAMEELGMTPVDLFDPSNLRELVLRLSGEQDQMALLTNGDLFAKLQNMLSMAEDMKASLAELMGVEPEDMQALLAEIAARGDIRSAETGIAGSEAEEELAAPQITVEVKSGDETVKLTADEDGNAVKTLEVVPSKAEENVARDHAGGQGEKSSDESGRGSEDALSNPFIASGQEGAQAGEVTFEQTTPFFSEQTRDIMNQIMDYMRIQLKPGMEQLEMQLHPESLGTVHIQLLSKGGEITAQFQVQNEAVRAALESQISTLQESLKEQGVRVEAVQVTVENHGFDSNLWQGQGREENPSPESGRKSHRRINLNDLDVNGLLEEEASEEEILAAKMMAANGNTVDYTV